MASSTDAVLWQVVADKLKSSNDSLATANADVQTLKPSTRVAGKEKNKDELDTYDATVLSKHHNAINEYLTQFGARVPHSESKDLCRQSAPMDVVHNRSEQVPVTKQAGQGEPSFQNAMNTGHKSTSALAFVLKKSASEQYCSPPGLIGNTCAVGSGASCAVPSKFDHLRRP